MFENFPFPGAPYLIAAFISMWAFLHTYELSDQPSDTLAFIYKCENPRDAPETVSLLCGELSEAAWQEEEEMKRKAGWL